MGSWRRCHGGTCLPVAHVLSGVDFHSPRPARYIDCEMTTLSIARSQRQPPEVALFLWGPARHLVAGGWWLLPIMERMTLCSPWNNYSGYRFAFPPCIVSAKAMCDFQNAPLCLGITCHIASDQAADFTQVKCGSCSWNACPYHVPHCPKAAELIQQGNVFLKTHCTSGGSSLWLQGNVLCNVV